MTVLETIAKNHSQLFIGSSNAKIPIRNAAKRLLKTLIVDFWREFA